MVNPKITLELDLETAKLLLGHLYDVGEHHAAGAEIPRNTPDEFIKLSNVIKDLDKKIKQVSILR